MQDKSKLHGKVINREFFKRLKLIKLSKCIWTNHNPSKKSLWNSKIHGDHQIPAWGPHRMLSKKNIRIWHLMNFTVPANNRKRKKREKVQKYLDVAWELKNCGIWKRPRYKLQLIWYTQNSLQRRGQKTRRIGNQRKNRNTPDHCIFRLARLLRRDLEAWGVLLSLRLHWKTAS